MKNKWLFMLITWSIILQTNNAQTPTPMQEKNTDRIARSDETYKKLFGGPSGKKRLDPELMDILKRFIFGDMFHAGTLDDTTRELITLSLLTSEQTFPQLKAHVRASLKIGIAPMIIKETIYQCAPLIGFPRTLNAIHVVNEIFTEQKITLPLASAQTTTEENRLAEGQIVAEKLYGDSLKNITQDIGVLFTNYLNAFYFGDFYTRKGLDLKTRELLTMCVLSAQGAREMLRESVLANLKVGNDKRRVLSALMHCMAYIGLPRVLAAIKILRD